MTRRRARWAVVLALLLLAQLAAVVVWQQVDRSRGSAGLPVAMELRSDPGHDLLVERPDGSSQLVAARSGRLQLVHFWATWCPPCRSELPTLVDLERRERDRLQVWIVSTDPDWRSIRKFFKGAMPPTVVRDARGDHRAYGVTVLPDSYLLGPDGRVIARFAGGQNWRSRDMGKILDRLGRGERPLR